MDSDSEKGVDHHAKLGENRFWDTGERHHVKSWPLESNWDFF